MAVLWTCRAPFLGRHMRRELLRNALFDFTPIIPATACQQSNYVERYSRFKGRSRYARCFLTRRWLSLVLEQLQKPLSAPARELPPGQALSRDTGARLGKGRCLLVR